MIRRRLEKDVEDGMRRRLYEKVERARLMISKMTREDWVRAIRESRERR